MRTSNILRKVVLVLTVMLIAHNDSTAQYMKSKDWRSLRFRLSEYMVDIYVPEPLRRGFGQPKIFTDLDLLKSDKDAARYEGQYVKKTLATFYLGGKGDEFSVAFDLNVMTTPVGVDWIDSYDTITDFFLKAEREPILLEDGSSFITDVSAYKEEQRGRQFLRIKSENLDTAQSITLKSGAYTTLMPFWLYIVKVDNRALFTIYVAYYDKRKITPEKVAQIQELSEELIERLNIGKAATNSGRNEPTSQP